MLLTLKRAARRALDASLKPIGYTRNNTAGYLPDVLGFRMFQNPGDAGINYAALRGQTPADYPFGEIGLAKTLKPSDVVLDLGANIGFFTLLYSDRAAHVHAFEPGIHSYALLQANVAINGRGNVTTYHKAVADYDGNARFLLCTTGDSDNRLLDNSGEVRQEIDMEVVRLDTLFSGSKVDFIKMDIQGAECIALKGLAATVAANPTCRMLVEYSPLCLAQAGSLAGDLLALCRKMGFALSIVHEDRAPEPTSELWLAANCGPGLRHPHVNLLLTRP